MVIVEYEDQGVNLPLIVVKIADKAALFGLQWLEHYRVELAESMLHAGIYIRSVGETHRRFRERLGMLKGIIAKIYVVSVEPSKFFKSRSVPYALKRKVEEELDRLVQMKLIEPVCYSD